MQPERSLYDVLGVGRTATPKEIRAAYVRLARQLHPDKQRQQSKTEDFKEVQQAYETLSDPHRRLSYDWFGVDFADEGNVDTQLFRLLAACCCCCLCTLLFFGLLIVLKVTDLVDTPWLVIFLPVWLLDACLFIPAAATFTFSSRRDPLVAAEAAVISILSITLYLQLAGYTDSWMNALMPLVLFDVCKSGGLLGQPPFTADDAEDRSLLVMACRPVFVLLSAAKGDGMIGISWWAVLFPVWLRVTYSATEYFADRKGLAVSAASYAFLGSCMSGAVSFLISTPLLLASLVWAAQDSPDDVQANRQGNSFAASGPRRARPPPPPTQQHASEAHPLQGDTVIDMEGGGGGGGAAGIPTAVPPPSSGGGGWQAPAPSAPPVPKAYTDVNVID